MEYLQDSWNGKLSLKLTFYINFLAINIVAILPWGYMQATSTQGRSSGLMIYLFMVLIITCWSAVGVFNCVARIGKEKSENNKSLSLFEKFTIALAFLWLMIVIFQAYTTIKHSNEELQQHSTITNLQLNK